MSELELEELELEIRSLKISSEFYEYQKDALNQIINELFQANVALKIESVVQKKHIAKLGAQMVEKDNTIKKLSDPLPE